MAQILIRNLDEAVVERLKQRARRRHRSLQGEVTEILERAVRTDASRFLEQAAALRRQLAGRHFTDSGELIAEDRAR